MSVPNRSSLAALTSFWGLRTFRCNHVRPAIILHSGGIGLLNALVVGLLSLARECIWSQHRIMCTTKFWRGPKCCHTWAEIVKPCAEKKNFSNCPSFTNGKARKAEGLKTSLAPAKSCPKCDKKDKYDGDKIRMVKGGEMQYGCRLGLGPSKTDKGVDFPVGKPMKFLGKGKGPEVRVVCCIVM